MMKIAGLLTRYSSVLQSIERGGDAKAGDAKAGEEVIESKGKLNELLLLFK